MTAKTKMNYKNSEWHENEIDLGKRGEIPIVDPFQCEIGFTFKIKETDIIRFTWYIKDK
jgi:hypothetical protein